MSWVLVSQLVVNGLLVGGLYACMGIAFSLLWGVMNIINLAHGSMILAGAYVTFWLNRRYGIDPVLTLPFAAGLLFCFGYGLQWLVLNRVVVKSIFLTLVLTFGINMVLINIMLVLFTADVRSITTGYSTLSFNVWGVRISAIRLLVFVLALALTFALHLFLTRSRSGRAIRATAQDPRAARIIGIGTGHVYALTFGLGAAMAGATGSLITMVYVFSPVIGDPLTLKSFVVVILGGLGNMFGAILAGIFLGIAENLIAGFGFAGYRDAVSFAILLAVLLLRPRGFLGKSSFAENRA